MASSGASVFDSPPEIRSIIYCHVIEFRRTYLLWSAGARLLAMSRKRTTPTEFDFSPMLLWCKTIFGETLPLLYGRTTSAIMKTQNTLGKLILHLRSG